jgi:predicted PurR-regulated permease PerM
VVAGLLTYIPNLGPTLGLIPALLLAFQQGPQMALYVFVFYVTLQSLELYVITPLVQRQGAKLPPVVTIGSQVLMGSVTGILGLTVATPLALAVMVLIKELYIKDTLGQASAQVIASAASDGSLSHGE